MDLQDLDSNVVSLVTELNRFPGIVTFSSCGGHPIISNQSQRPAGEFEVNFDVFPLLGGWRSLELIVSAVAESADLPKLSIVVWSLGGGTAACFELSGRDGADPGLLAGTLPSFRAMFDDDVLEQ